VERVDENHRARQENWIDPLPQRLQQRLPRQRWRYYERGEPVRPSLLLPA